MRDFSRGARLLNKTRLSLVRCQLPSGDGEHLQMIGSVVPMFVPSKLAQEMPEFVSRFFLLQGRRSAHDWSRLKRIVKDEVGRLLPELRLWRQSTLLPSSCSLKCSVELAVKVCTDSGCALRPCEFRGPLWETSAQANASIRPGGELKEQGPFLL